MAARKFAVSVKQLVLSVLCDRILAVLALILLVVLAFPTISHPLGRAAWFGAAAVIVVGVSGILLLPTIERMLDRWRHQRFVHLILRMVQGCDPWVKLLAFPRCSGRCWRVLLRLLLPISLRSVWVLKLRPLP